MSIPLTAVNFASQGGTPIVVRSLDYESQCCCGCPCVEWSRFTSGSPIFGNPPPPSFPCCGLAQAYSLETVDGFGSEPEGVDAKFRLSGSILLAANLQAECVWSGGGASVQVFNYQTEQWENFDGQFAIAACLNRPTACEYEVILNINPLGFAISFRKSRGARQGPEGIYSASGSQYGSVILS
jgi:hypothetical protein